MILTGDAIRRACAAGDIIIDPFNPRHLNPNSYNYRLQPSLLEVIPTDPGTPHYHEHQISEGGFLLRPGCLYLGSTVECIGSSRYVMVLSGRSTMGRLGLFVNITADLGHCGSASQWTLEITVVQPLRVYANMVVGQVSFWVQQG